MMDSKARFLEVYETEYERTMRVLRAYPADRLDLRPHPKSRSARELAWVFSLERGLGIMVLKNTFATAPPTGTPPPAPESWPELLAGIERSHREFGDLVRSLSDEELVQNVRFFVGPKTMGDYRRIDFCWFLLHDQIHHRGQFSVYLRMADGKVPSIYGPTADEPWM